MVPVNSCLSYNKFNDVNYRQGYFVGLLFAISLVLGIGIEIFFGGIKDIFGLLIILYLGYFLIPYFWTKFVLKS